MTTQQKTFAINSKDSLRVKAEAKELPCRIPLAGRIEDHEILYAMGSGGKEFTLIPATLPAGGWNLSCQTGRCCNPHEPWLLLRHKSTKRGAGILIAYPGNWRIDVTEGDGKTVLAVDTVPGGLKPYETVGGLPIPGILVSYFKGEWDDGAIPISRFIREHLVRKNIDPNWPPVQYNTWFGVYDNPEENLLLDLAKKSVAIGCELFTVDAGWFGSKPWWGEAYGDWWINTAKLPNGFKPVAKLVHELGMKFGTWIEIECAHPNSRVGLAHPDWFLRRAGELLTPRGCLNFGKPEVVAWAKGEIDRVVSEHLLDYLKMDFNTDLGDGGDKTPDGSDPLWAHYRGLADLWKHIRKTFPNLIVENCASGGLRMTPATAAHFDTHWVSDEVKNHNNLAINFGMTYLYPPEICSHWTCYPDSTPAMDLRASFMVNLLGHFGLSGALQNWNAEALSAAADIICLYKKIRPSFSKSDVYHLTSQVAAGNPCHFQAVQYVNRETTESWVFLFRANDPSETVNLKIRGLNDAMEYRLEAPAGVARKSATGSDLKKGIDFRLTGTGSAAAIRLALWAG